MNALKFRKMHGLGNDFIIVDARAAPPVTAATVIAMSDRHFGIGCDQFIQLEQSSSADLFMRIYNQDGSQSGACGNATRCVAHLEMAATGKDALTIETISGHLPCRRSDDPATPDLITVDMGPARLDWQEIPLANAHDTAAVALTNLELGAVVCVNMGNPHAVLFVDNAEAFPLDAIGPSVEHHPLFPQRTNFEVVSVVAPNHLRQRTFERGVGITLACGSGACAVAVAAVRKGLTDRRVTIELDGGQLHLEWRESDDHVLMTGPIAYSFEGLWRG